jgi:hypothetical protein
MADTCTCCSPRITLRAVVLVVIAVLLGSLAYFQWLTSSASNTSDYIASTQYQAVFLDNGQVYFGKLTDENNDYLVLDDIYYLQRTAPLQGENSQGGGELSLVKLGNELHGPEDVMYISKANILFFENLKDDSRVATAIREYKGK